MKLKMPKWMLIVHDRIGRQRVLGLITGVLFCVAIILFYYGYYWYSLIPVAATIVVIAYLYKKKE